MSKHTLGPWEILNGKFVPTQMAAGSKMYVIQTADEHNDNIGFACSWLDDPETLREARANANLIAAAPDLLEALESLVKMAIAGDEYSYADWGKDYVEDERVTKAKAIIARAKGESQ